jgi:hypothetical protein
MVLGLPPARFDFQQVRCLRADLRTFHYAPPVAHRTTTRYLQIAHYTGELPQCPLSASIKTISNIFKP